MLVLSMLMFVPVQLGRLACALHLLVPCPRHAHMYCFAMRLPQLITKAAGGGVAAAAAAAAAAFLTVCQAWTIYVRTCTPPDSMGQPQTASKLLLCSL